jgi:hypothetical protein
LEVLYIFFVLAITASAWEKGYDLLTVISLVICWLFVVVGVIVHFIPFHTPKNRELLTLNEEVGNLKAERHALITETLYHSAVYAKVESIVDTLRKSYTKETLSEEEWRKLIALVDQERDGKLMHLDISYGLSRDEIHICCLYLIDIPVSYIGHFVKGYTRNTIQAKARNILQKIGAPKNALLKDILLSGAF